MNESKIQHLTVGGITGVVVGLLLFGKTSENQRLMTERDQFRKQLDELTASLPRARTYVRQGNGGSQAREFEPQLTAGRARVEITDEDRSRLEALEVRRSKGEYVNWFEDPVKQKSLKESITKGVQTLAARNRANLDPVFTQLGLSDNTRELLQLHVSKINEAAMEAQASILQLQNARTDYDEKLRSLLAPGDYERYKQHEASGPAQREYDNMKSFAERQNQVIAEDERENLVAIIRDAKAYPQQNYLGPYDGLPTVALVVDGSGSGYLRSVCDYVHLNPVRAKLLGLENRLLEYPWSSFGYYLSAKRHRPSWLRVDRLLGEHGITEDTPQGRREFEQRMEMRRGEESDGEEWKKIRRGWCLGSTEFREKLLEKMESELGDHHAGQLHQESAQAKGERLISEELKRLRWKRVELEERAKGDPAKLALAMRLRSETTLTIREIAKSLHMGSWKSLNNKLYVQKRTWQKARNGKVMG